MAVSLQIVQIGSVGKTGCGARGRGLGSFSKTMLDLYLDFYGLRCICVKSVAPTCGCVIAQSQLRVGCRRCVICTIYLIYLVLGILKVPCSADRIQTSVVHYMKDLNSKKHNGSTCLALKSKGCCLYYGFEYCPCLPISC